MIVSIEKIIFRNEENGYSVLEVLDNNTKDKLIAVGTFSRIDKGDLLSIEGEWDVHPIYGHQFKVNRYSYEIPHHETDVIKLLSAGLVKGIGEKLARIIVKTIGSDAIQKIEEQPDILLSVPGIGKKRAKMIIDSIKEKNIQKELMMFFVKHDIPVNLANRIYNTYGPEAIKVIKENPYRLAQEIWGIGFKKADKIGLGIGIPKNDAMRIKAALFYELNNSSNEGHVFLPESILIEYTSNLLEIEKEKISECINELCEAKKLIREQTTFEGDKIDNIIYLPHLWLAEQEVATELKKRIGEFKKINSTTDKLIHIFESKTGINLDDVQKEAIKGAISNKIFIITGGPGTGKTTIINCLLFLYKNLNIKYALAAPTGRAAHRLKELTKNDAQTIHKLLEYNPIKNDFDKNNKNLLQYSSIIVDEASMIDIYLFRALLKAIPNDAQLIIIGDKDQLPSVGPGNVLRDLINSNVISRIVLKQIYRQAKNSLIIKGAFDVNRGLFPFMITKKGEEGDFYFISEENPERAIKILIKILKEKFSSYSKKELAQKVQIIVPMYKGIVGVDNLNMILRDTLNPVNENTIELNNFRTGDKVMQIVNNYMKNVFNGDIGYVIEIDPFSKKILVQYPDKIVQYNQEEFEELTLAYAITAHKAEGSEFDTVIIILYKEHYIMLKRNWLYTAITRAKKKLIIIGEKEAIDIAIRNQSSVKRYTLLMKRLI
jgi:exodeoxyribonuclease V alpha subunit